MNALHGRRILLGISGGIAAYKAAELTRRLVEAGAQLQVVMTASAERFITKLTLQALSGRAVRSSLWDEAAELGMGHIELARWAEAIVIAPASADCLARLAQGRADDLLTTLCLASEAPLLLAPAMNHVMWAKPATQANCALLAERGVVLLGPAEGELAERETGLGRMLEPLEIRKHLIAHFGGGALAGNNVLVTAGPTREPLDPVRYLSNRSSGRMGYALAAACARAGATVTLISGPTALAAPAGVQRVDVETAGQMHQAVLARAPDQDIFIAAAAVADYAPAQAAEHKIKKGGAQQSLALARTPDILAEAARAHPRLFSVGFAAETRDLESRARGKLESKGVAMVAANLVGNGRAFDQPDNALYVCWRGGEMHLPRTGKPELARQLVALVAERLAEWPVDPALVAGPRAQRGKHAQAASSHPGP